MCELFLVGAGEHAINHAHVLIAQNIDFEVIGRGRKSAKIFQSRTGRAVKYFDFAQAVNENPSTKTFIIAVSFENLTICTKIAVKFGASRILLEKPGAITDEEFNSLKTLSNSCDIFIALNRRHYENVIFLRERVELEGGVNSLFFDFSENMESVKNLKLPSHVSDRWLLANSLHVIDLAFFLAGKPETISSISVGGNDVHPATSKFAGFGTFPGQKVFSYFADWDSPGRWAVNISTPKTKYILCPLEGIKAMKMNSFDIVEIPFKRLYDTKFKPGLYLQSLNFINRQDDNLVSLNEYEDIWENCKKIAGYK